MTPGNTTSATTEHLGGIEGNQACMLVSVADIRAHTPVRLHDAGQNRLATASQTSKARTARAVPWCAGTQACPHTHLRNCAGSTFTTSNCCNPCCAGHFCRKQDGRACATNKHNGPVTSLQPQLLTRRRRQAGASALVTNHMQATQEYMPFRALRTATVHFQNSQARSNSSRCPAAA